jgi:hypothetical protein
MVARKIAVIQMPPDMESGGVESVTLETAAYLVKHGHRSMVISAGDHGTLFKMQHRLFSPHPIDHHKAELK